MANPMSQVLPPGTMHGSHQQRKMQNGSPKTAHNKKAPSKSSVAKISNGHSTGDVVSDESDNGDDDGDSSAIGDDGNDSDEPDDFALSGTVRIGCDATSRLAGLSRKNDKTHQAASGAQQSTGHESDEDDYHAVEDISDDDDSVGDIDETNILRSAEQDLIAEFERHERPGTANGVTNDMNGMSLVEDADLARRSSVQSDDSQQDPLDYNLDFSMDPFVGLPTDNDLYKVMLEDAEEVFEGHMSSWRRPDTSSRENSAPSNTQKKVRFEETTSSRASSMSSEDDPRDSFPDLFDDLDDPSLRQQIILGGMDIDDVAQDNESIYDFEYEDELAPVAYDQNASSDSDSEMSDSESDDGDTTDEETAEEQLARVKKLKETKKGNVPSVGTLQGAPSTPAASKRSTPDLSRSNSNASNSQYATPMNTGRRPKTGTFVHDPTQASVTADIKGSGVKLVCPSKPPEKDREYWERARLAMGSRDGSPGGSVSWTRTTPRTAASIPQRPFTVKSTLGTMFDGNLDFPRSNDEHGIAKELLMPSRKNSMQESFTSNTLTDGDGSDESSNVNMAEFVQMDESDSDMEDDPVTGDLMSPQQDFFTESFMESSPAANRDNRFGLLDHFDQQRGLVSSFRNNQHHARHVSSLAAHPAKRAQASEANALQKGRRAAANTPITPARKKRPELDVTGAGVKKIASPLVHKHRRSRGSSLSGMHQTLAVDRFTNNAH